MSAQLSPSQGIATGIRSLVGLPVARWKSTYRRAVILTDLIVIALAFRIGLLVIDGRLQVPGAAVFGAVLIAAILGRPWDLRVLGQGAEEFRRLGSAVFTAVLALGLTGLAADVGYLWPWVFAIVWATGLRLSPGLMTHRV